MKVVVLISVSWNVGASDHRWNIIGLSEGLGRIVKDWTAHLSFFDPDEIVVFFLVKHALHVPIEIVVDILRAITGTECFEEKVMIVLLFNF